VNERTIDVGEVRLHVVSDGPVEGAKTVLLLHGFPEFWYSWRHQIEALAGAGYHVVVPDLRGYNLSDKPEGVQAYRLSRLAGDLDGLIAALGRERVHLVGHDWGASLAWYYAAERPERVERLAILNGPHPLIMTRALRTWTQMRKSWHVFFFQLPRLPEWMVLREGYIARGLRSLAVKQDAFTDEDLARYDEAMARPGAATATINWYRAAVRGGEVSTKAIGCPTLVIWGEGDPSLGPSLLDGLDRLVTDLHLVRIPGAGHWVQQEAPAEVSRELLAFFRDSAGRSPG
jgi:pimeloyl-ACP methyl ester carboxylesterase